MHFCTFAFLFSFVQDCTETVYLNCSMMTQSDSTSLTWVIEDFTNVLIFKESSVKFECKHNTFWLTIFSKDNLPSLDNHFAMYLCREKPHSTDVKVLWTIWLINDRGEECYGKDIETIYTADSEHCPIEGGLYHLDRDIILNSSSGLLTGGNLTVKSTVTILDGQTTDDKKIRLAQKKTLENYESLLVTGKYSDVVFVIGEKEFKLHKAILSSQSSVFFAMFDNDLEEAKQNRFEITDIDVKVFDAMIRFIYTGNVLDSIKQYALDLFFAADKYQIDSLRDICADVLGFNLTTELLSRSSSSSLLNIEANLVDDSSVEETSFEEHLELKRNEAVDKLQNASTSSSGNRKRKTPTGVSASKNTKKAKTRSGGHYFNMFACKFQGCDVSFSSESKLATHECIHLGIKPFSCTWPDCKYASAKRSDIVRHVRSVHFKFPQSVKKQSELNMFDNRDPNEFVRVDQQLANRRL